MGSLSIPQIFGIVVLCAAAALGIYTLAMAPQSQQIAEPEIDIGGPFEMVDHLGNAVTQDSYKGKFMLVYFGFTYCPDICPTELQEISTALNALTDEELEKLQPLFVTVDPERDTVEEMAGYVTHFHPKFVGLTGSLDQVRHIADEYRVWFKKLEDDESTDGYTMEHTNIIYLMGPDGKFLEHFNFATKSDEMAQKISRRLAATP